MSIFGDAGCSNTYNIPCTVAPGSISFTAANDMDDPTSGLAGVYNNCYKNATFDHAGSLLFTVNAHGIYGNSGTQLFSFSGTLTNSVLCSGVPTDVYTSLDHAASEIVTVPVPGDCHSYYVFFWQHVDLTAVSSLLTDRYLFRCVKISIGSSYPADGAYTFTDHIFNTIDCSGYSYHQSIGSLQVAADKYNADGTRDIYSVHSEGTPAASNTKLLRWRISAFGALPAAPTVVATSLPQPRLEKMKIFNVPVSGGTDRLLSYVTSSSGYSELLYTYNLASGAGVSYKAPLTTYGAGSSVDGYQCIWGFEYLPSVDIFCFAYSDRSFAAGPPPGYTAAVGGLGYAARATSGVAGITAISSTTNYLFSDLELSKNGDLFLVHEDLSAWPADGPGSLAYIPASSFSSISSAAPTVFSIGSCSGHPSVSVASTKRSVVDVITFYLGTQIRGEDYDQWGNVISLNYTVSGTETWTPASNPVNGGSGPPLYDITMANITVPAGTALNIVGLTIKMTSGSHIDVMAGSGTAGGHLYLENSVLTAHLGGCDNPYFSMWGGVRLYGNPAYPHAPVGSTPLVQGYMRMINSEISYATTGVTAGVSYTTGGGFLEASGSTFRNNSFGVTFTSYAPINHSYLDRCKFTTDDPATIVGTAMFHVSGASVRGIWIGGCEFENHCGTAYETHGVFMTNSCFTVEQTVGAAPGGGSIYYPSKFTDLKYGISHYGTSPYHAATVRNSVFRYNKIGVNMVGSYAPVVVNNTFYVPWGLLSLSYPYYTPVWSPVRTIGLQLFSATAFGVYGNKFQFASASGIGPASSNNTVGVLAWNTGISNNVINNNFYKGLGTANLANYRNRNVYGDYGLWYKCNTNSDNRHDIATKGKGKLYPADGGGGILMGPDQDGIKPNQRISLLLPAGNTFSFGGYNIYSKRTECFPIDYYYAATGSGGSPANEPGIAGVTGAIYDGYNSKYSISAANRCSLGGYGDPIDAVATGGLGGALPRIVNPNDDDDIRYTDITSNISYYACDTNGMTHPDSLYYWLHELHTPDADAGIAAMLVADSFIDSAYTLYGAIPATYALDSADSVEFAHWGKRLLTVLIADAIKAGVPTTSLSFLADHIDTLTDSAYTSLKTVELIDVFHNARGFMRVKAENMIRELDRVLLDSLLTEMPDTLLYPEMPDSVEIPPAAKGVLAVTEMSLGAEYGCQYAELVVANCGSDASSYVDIRGWVINDNSGIFNVTDPLGNPNGDCDENVGITPGHYRIPYDTLWANVPIGSFLVLYNAANNCYNLPDSFTLDSFNSIYYIPVGAVSVAVLEKYTNDVLSPCSYCAGSGPTTFSAATDWMNTIGFDSTWDGLQVLCPGCSPDYAIPPAFYHGIGYRESPAADGTLKQSAVLKNSEGPGLKYVFAGSSATDITSHAQWTVSIADTAGVVPPTLGKVSIAFYTAITDHELGLPCCGTQQEEEGPQGKLWKGDRRNLGDKSQSGAIKAYPNPTNMMLYFEFPPAGDVSIRITDVTGRVIDQQSVHNVAKASFNVMGYTPGVYMYHVITNGTTQTGKIVIAN